MAGETREFVNDFPDFKSGETTVPYNLSTNEVDELWKKELCHHVDYHLKRLERGLAENVDWNDYSIYTGTSGISFLYLHLSNVYVSRAKEFLKKALSYVEPSLESLKRRRFSFLNGDAGPLAVAAVIYHKLDLQAKANAVLKKLENLHENVINLKSDIPDEVLYGRAGYLSSVLFVRKHIAPDCIDTSIILQVINAILTSGTNLAKKEKWESPLMYKWHDKYYLGAAHGISGIVFVLLQATECLTDDQKNSLLKPTIQFLMSLRYPSGNYPSSIGNDSDKLIHWCHGSPGFAFMFAAAYKAFGKEQYLNEALSCGNVIWQRGLLRKGYGLCHGVAGNGFVFLLMFTITKDSKHLYRALKFAEWCFEMKKRKCRTPDRPFSLFEGLAGTIYFLASLLDVETAAFPTFFLA